MLLGRKATEAGLKWVAGFEAFKGTLALAAAFGFLRYAEGQVEGFIESSLIRFRFNPEHREFQSLLEAAARVDSLSARVVLAFALLYSIFRYVEAYGLWKKRAWGEWIAILSTGIYVPLEIWELGRGFAWFKLIVTVANVAVFVFLIYAFRQQRKLATLRSPGEHRGNAEPL